MSSMTRDERIDSDIADLKRRVKAVEIATMVIPGGMVGGGNEVDEVPFPTKESMDAEAPVWFHRLMTFLGTVSKPRIALFTDQWRELQAQAHDLCMHYKDKVDVGATKNEAWEEALALSRAVEALNRRAHDRWLQGMSEAAEARASSEGWSAPAYVWSYVTNHGVDNGATTGGGHYYLLWKTSSSASGATRVAKALCSKIIEIANGMEQGDALSDDQRQQLLALKIPCVLPPRSGCYVKPTVRAQAFTGKPMLMPITSAEGMLFQAIAQMMKTVGALNDRLVAGWVAGGRDRLPRSYFWSLADFTWNDVKDGDQPRFILWQETVGGGHKAESVMEGTVGDIEKMVAHLCK
jgi:hypothetical protein